METFGIQEKKEIKWHQRTCHLRGTYAKKTMLEKLKKQEEEEAKENEKIQKRMNNPMKHFGGHDRYPLTIKNLHEDFGRLMKTGRKPYYYSTKMLFTSIMEEFKGDVNPNRLYDKLRDFCIWVSKNTIFVEEEIYDLLIHHRQINELDGVPSFEAKHEESVSQDTIKDDKPAIKVVADLFTHCDDEKQFATESDKPYIPGYLSRFHDLSNFVPSKVRLIEYQRAKELGIKKSSAKYLYWLICQGDLDLVLSFSFSVATSHEDERFDTQVRYVQAIVRYVLQSDQTDYSRDSQGCLQLMKHLWSMNDDVQLDFLANIL